MGSIDHILNRWFEGATMLSATTSKPDLATMKTIGRLDERQRSKARSKPLAKLGVDQTKASLEQLTIDEIIRMLVERMPTKLNLVFQSFGVEIRALMKYHDQFLKYLGKHGKENLTEHLRNMFNVEGIILEDEENSDLSVQIRNMLFYRFLISNKGNKPEPLVLFHSRLVKTMKQQQFKHFGNMFLNCDLSLDNDSKITLHHHGKNILMYLDVKTREGIAENLEIYQEIIDAILVFVSLEREEVKQDLFEICQYLDKQLKSIFDPVKAVVEEMYETIENALIRDPAQKVTKRKIYSAIHGCLEPYFANLHSYDERKRLMKYTVLDKRVFQDHQRNSIKSLMKL